MRLLIDRVVGWHTGEMRSQTAKLPKTQGYPLSPSALDDALKRAGVSIDVLLIRQPGTLFDAHFWPPNPNVPYERLYVRVGSVPVDQVGPIRREFEAKKLPVLVEWIASILAHDLKSPVRREEQMLDLRVR
ncbi:conserved hypothetical protein [Bradyrhizobium sp. ORS 375]|nr:conserved hypothetical protein [Bradyrhizobium sp. ORS 375]